MKLADIEALYQRYGAMVLHRARGILGDAEAAQRALEHVVLLALRAGPQFHDDPSPVTWVYRATTAHLLDVVRARGRRATADGSLGHVLGEVPEELRETAVCYFVDEMDVEEIAAFLDVAPHTVANRLDTFRAAVAGMEINFEVGEDDPTSVV